jgi:hypothetical protein
MAKYGMSTYGQGADCYIALPSRLSNTAGTAWGIGGTAICHDLSANRNLLGDSGSTQNVLRIYTDGSMAMRASANDRITAPAGSVIVDVVFAWEIRNNTDTGNWEMYFNGMLVGVYPRGSAAWAVNQLCRWSTTASPYFTIRSVYTFGAATFVDSWDHTTASSTGVNWLSTSGSRNLALIGAAGAADSWWHLYGAVAYVGEGTFSLTTKADVTLASAKVGNATMPAVAAAALATRGSKIGTTQMDMPITAGIKLSASKIGDATVSMPISAALGFAACKVGTGTINLRARVEFGLFASNVYIGEGTFAMSVAAGVELIGAKVGQSGIPFVAAASVQLQASKVGQSAAPVSAAVSLSAAGYKVGFGTIAVLATATISLSSSQAPEPDPVTVVFVRTSSRRVYNLRTSSRYSYTIKTSSGGTRV